jgi:hypothetical protein
MEDFVTFEIAKKLKEKGFNEKCFGWYYSSEVCGFDYKTTIVFNSSDYRGSNYKDMLVSHKNEKYIDTPTISQVLKWLREKKSIHIEISLGRNGWYFAIKQYKYSEKEGYYDCKLITVSITLDSFEAVALEGIEYTINNLI